jgi:hypothetical protein
MPTPAPLYRYGWLRMLMLSLSLMVFLKSIPVCDASSNLKSVGPDDFLEHPTPKKSNNKIDSLNALGKLFIMQKWLIVD